MQSEVAIPLRGYYNNKMTIVNTLLRQELLDPASLKLMRHYHTWNNGLTVHLGGFEEDEVEPGE
jgi:hypothetical protein